MNWKITDHCENTKEIHIEIWVSLFFVILSVGQKQGDYMKNRFEIQGNCLTVYLPREVDHPAADEIRRESDNILRKNYIRTMVFDFSETMFMDSSGIGLILGRQRIMETLGGGVAVKNPSPSVRRIIQVAGLSRLIISGKNTEDKK